MDETPEEITHLTDSVVGPVTLRAGDLERQVRFYEEIVGLSAAAGAEPDTAELRDAGGNALLVLDARTTRGAAPASVPHAGLFHTAFRYPDRATLGRALARVTSAGLVLGASDHGVSEALYIDDPDGNGVELYRDRPLEEWPRDASGEIRIVSEPLDLESVLASADGDGSAERLDVGHIHLKASDVARSQAFYGLLGLDLRVAWSSVAFLAEGLYHHHMGINSWHSAGAPPAPPDRPGLASFELRLRTPERVAAAAERLRAAGVAFADEGGGVRVADPDGTTVVVRSRG